MRLLKEMQAKIDKQVEDMKFFNKKARAEDYEDLKLGVASVQEQLRNLQQYHDRNKRQHEKLERETAELTRKVPDVENRLNVQHETTKTQSLLRMDHFDKTLQDLSSRVERTAKQVQKHDA